MVGELTLYKEVVTIAEDYFGPTAPRYINRLISGHIGKSPQQIQRQDLPELTAWIKVTVAMVTDEEPIIEEFMNRLNLLYKG